MEPANAAALTIDPTTLQASGPVQVRPPVLLPNGPAPASGLRVTRARRSGGGSILTLSGTIARAATAPISDGCVAEEGVRVSGAREGEAEEGAVDDAGAVDAGAAAREHVLGRGVVRRAAGVPEDDAAPAPREEEAAQGDTATEFSVEARAAG